MANETDTKRAAEDIHRAAEDLQKAIETRSDFASTITCGSHSGLVSDITGLGKALDSKAKILTWVIGIGMSLNIFAIGICSSYIVGTLNLHQVQVNTLTNDVSRIAAIQQTVLRRTDSLENQAREQDKRFDQMQWGEPSKLLHKR